MDEQPRTAPTTMPNSAPAVAAQVTKPYPSGWNWGAAGLTWIWGIRFNVWLSLLGFIPALGGIWWIVLGIKGNQWAWEAKQYPSVEAFNAAMAPWNKWGKILFIVSLALPFVMLALLIPFFSTSSTNVTY